LNKNILTIGIIFLLFASALTPIVLGYNRTIDERLMVEDEVFDRYLYPKFYDCYNVDEIQSFVEQPVLDKFQEYEDIKSEVIINSEESTQLLDGPMDSPWPMYCHDTRHTGRSPYSTNHIDNIDKWKFFIPARIWESSISIDKNGTIYIGVDDLYAINPNGTLKWKYDIAPNWFSIPAIDENGVLYIGELFGYPYCLYAIYTNNGTLKWKYELGYDDIKSSPAIGEDGTIYFCTSDGWENGSSWGSIRALNPDGTLKWRYKTDHVILSSPVIGEDGTIYFGCHNTYLYALYPNNGTLKWRYKTDNWIRTAPCIADDGTIYVVSLDDFLHAVNPDGSLKWKTEGCAGTSPTIGQDGTIYCGYENLLAVNPVDGSIKWSFNLGVDRVVRGATPCNSIDGTIYLGVDIDWWHMRGGEIVAVNPNGSEKWRKMIANDWVDSAPAIGEDGTVYICSTSHETNSQGYVKEMSYVHAFGPVESNEPPEKPTINQTKPRPGYPFFYSFHTNDPDRNPVSYYIDWGDFNYEWSWEYASGETGFLRHTYLLPGTYTIRAKAKDVFGAESDWATLEVTIHRNKATNNIGLFRFFEQFPILQKLLLLIK